jgi:hypothetical protein
VNLRKTTADTDWDERNGVEIRRIASAGEIDHKAAEPYEFVMPGRSGGPLDIVALYAPKVSKTLIVTFHGSLQRSKFQLPRFEWRRSLAAIDSAQLFVADSTLNLSSGIPLAWYIGTETQNLTSDVADLIRAIAASAGYERILLTGSSGGGFASLAVSRQISGSVAVCFSPQTRVGDYVRSAVGTFARVCFPGLDSYDSIEEQNRGRLDLRHLYTTTRDRNFVRYVQNTRDPFHYEKHYTPFAEARGVDPALGGLDTSGRIEFVPQRLQDGHEPPSRGRFRGHVLDAHRTFFGEELAVLRDEPALRNM